MRFYIFRLKEVQDILDSANDGVIYFSMGSNAKSKDFSPEVKNTLMKAFDELPFTILWKYEEDVLPGKPENVKIAKWLPQQDVLSKLIESVLNYCMLLLQLLMLQFYYI